MNKALETTPGMVKVTRLGLKAIKSVNIKPPEYVLDEKGGEDHIYKCVYVTPGGKQIKQRCTAPVWRKCEGKTGEGRLRDGLCQRTNTEFILWSDSNDVVVDIDVLPGDYYMARQVAPESIIDHEGVELIINQGTGSVEVKKTCLGLTRAKLERLINELNKLDRLSPGDNLPGNFEIMSISGNRVTVSVPSKG